MEHYCEIILNLGVFFMIFLFLSLVVIFSAKQIFMCNLGHEKTIM